MVTHSHILAWKIPGTEETGRLQSRVSPRVGLLSMYTLIFAQFNSCQSFSRVQLFETPWTASCQASLSITNTWSLLKLMSIKSVMPPNHFILCCPFLLLPSIISSIRVFSNESVLHTRCPEYWSFSSSICLSIFRNYFL